MKNLSVLKKVTATITIQFDVDCEDGKELEASIEHLAHVQTLLDEQRCDTAIFTNSLDNQDLHIEKYL